ncbi:MAG: hypothetical protein WC556_08780 [Candidatus Methanoperedens sp.]
MRNPFAAHDPSIKGRPSSPLIVGFAVKITHNFFGKHLFYLYYLILGAVISASMNCFGNKEPQMDADKRICKIHFVAHEYSLKKRPSFQLFMGFAVKINYTFSGKHLLN